MQHVTEHVGLVQNVLDVAVHEELGMQQLDTSPASQIM